MGSCDATNPLRKSLVLPQSNQIIFHSDLVMHAAIHLPFASLILYSLFFPLSEDVYGLVRSSD